MCLKQIMYIPRNIQLTGGANANKNNLLNQTLPKFNGMESNPNENIYRLGSYYENLTARKINQLGYNQDGLFDIIEASLEGSAARWWQLIKYETRDWSV